MIITSHRQCRIKTRTQGADAQSHRPAKSPWGGICQGVDAQGHTPTKRLWEGMCHGADAESDIAGGLNVSLANWSTIPIASGEMDKMSACPMANVLP